MSPTLVVVALLGWNGVELLPPSTDCDVTYVCPPKAEEPAPTPREVRRAEIVKRNWVGEDPDATLELEDAQEAVRVAEEKLAAKCGRAYQRIRIGDSWKRVEECAGPFDLIAQLPKATVYEGPLGRVWIRAGKVAAWVAPQ